MRTAALMAELRESLTGKSPSSPERRAFDPKLPCGPAPADRALLDRLKASTVAQIGVGRAGTRLRTTTLLKFLGDRAVAVEAVRSKLPADFPARLRAVLVHSEARDLDEFLLRPDLGRRLPQNAIDAIRSSCEKQPDVQLVVGDGLSAHAVTLNAPPLLEALTGELARVGLRAATTVLIQRARMKTLGVVGEATGARTGVILLGERPGLGTGDGMSAYLVHRPRLAAVESDHEVVSNIHARGIPPAEAARKIADLLAEFVRTGLSGVPRQAAPAGSTSTDLRPVSNVEPNRRDPLDRREPPRSSLDVPLATSAAARCAR